MNVKRILSIGGVLLLALALMAGRGPGGGARGRGEGGGRLPPPDFPPGVDAVRHDSRTAPT